MSPATRQRGDGSAHPARREAVQPLTVAWLTVLWVALWGDLSAANVLSGALLGVVVSWVLPMPPLRLRLRVRPLRLAALVGHFLLDVVVASAHVVWVVLVVRPVRSAVVEVSLSTPSDIVLTVVAELTSLVPGSVVVEVRRSSHTLFIHVLDTPDLAAVERSRRRTLELERRVVLALGEDTSAVMRPAPHGGRP